MKRIPVLLFALISIITLASCGSAGNAVTTSVSSCADTEKTAQEETGNIAEPSNKGNSKEKTTDISHQQINGQIDEKTGIVTAQAIDTGLNTDHTRTGVMAFSDSADNKYIKLVADKYGVSPSVLAAIYTLAYEGMEQEADGNIVLQFDGSVDSEGKLIRTEDTLEMIYMIDADDVCTKASVDGSQQDDYNAAKRKVVVLFTTRYIMPKFQSELY